MPDLIALEWNRQRIRVVAGTVRGHNCRIDHLQTIILEKDEGDGLPDPAMVGARIGEVLREWKAGKVEALVAVSRAQAELRLLNVPPAPDDELPDMVRFQALQQFTSLDDACPLDFMPTGESPGGAKQVLTAAIPSQLMRHVQETVEHAGTGLRGLILRPCGTVSLVRRHLRLDPDEVQLVVEAHGDEAELTAFSDQSALLARTVRLPKTAEHGPSHAALVNEVRRTLMAARTQLGGRQITGIVLCGPRDQSELTAMEQLGLPVQSFNPFSDIQVSTAVQRDMPADFEHFAPLLGILLDEASESKHEIDFLRPRRPAEPPDRRKMWTATALVAACSVLLFGSLFWWRSSALDKEITELRRKSQELDGLVEVAQREQQLLDEIDAWYADSPNWLIELRDLSENLPAADKLRLEQLQGDLGSKGGGTLLIKGFVDDSATVADLESRLRDSRHGVQGLDRERKGDDPNYPWHFSERIRVEPPASEIETTSPELRETTAATSPGGTERATP